MPVGMFAGQGITLVSSAARSTSSNSGNLKDGTASLPQGDRVAFILDVTANAGDAPVLDVMIDTSPDGGTSWYRTFTFTQITGSTATRRIDCMVTGLGIAGVGVDTSIAGTTGSLVVNTVLTRDIRVRWVLAGVGAGAGATFAVHAIVTSRNAIAIT